MNRHRRRSRQWMSSFQSGRMYRACAPSLQRALAVSARRLMDNGVTDMRCLAAFTGTRPAWLKQIHHVQVIRAETALDQNGAPYADASVATQPHMACVITS